MKHNTSTSFGSDNHSGIHPKVWTALENANRGHAHAYGGDDWTREAIRAFRKCFGAQANVHFVFNGTAANVLALTSITAAHEAIICSDLAHLNVDECGAPEYVAGLKLLSVPSVDGKISPIEIEKLLIRKGDQHYRQPAVLSLTQPTEYGTVYSKSEMDALIQLAKKHQLKIHLDGSRLANAAVARGQSFADLVSGADVVSFGGTKNGLLGAEAVIFLKPAVGETHFAFTRKQGMQLGSKMRFMAAQFIAYLEQDLWRDIATHESTMAKKLRDGLGTIAGVTVTRPVESNAVFVILPKNVAKAVREKYFFYIWDEETWEARLMISFDITENDVDQFVQCVREEVSKDLG